MQNEFLPEETLEYRTPATIAPQTGSAIATNTAAANTLTAAEIQTRLRNMNRAARRRVYRFALALIAISVAPMFIALMLSAPAQAAVIRAIFVAFSVVAGTLGGVFLINKRAKPVQEYAQIARDGGAAAVGPLLELRRDNLTPANGSAIDAALALCLPQMRAEDAGKLNPAQRRLLLSFLRIAPIGEAPDAARTDFRVAALQALAQIGEASDLPLVEGIAGMDAKKADTLRVQEAAQECLPLLKVRLGLLSDAKTLLRASTPENETGGTLLRAASGPNVAKPNELLRPSDDPTP